MTAHLFIIHFPVTLVLIGAAFDVAGVALTERTSRIWGGRFLMLAGAAIFLAFATGEGARLAALGRGGVDEARLDLHQQWGSVGAWAVVAACLFRGLWRHRLNGGWGALNLLLAIAAAALAIAITVSGTLIRHSA